MGLDREADRQAQDAGRHKPFFKEAPDGHHAKAYNDPSGIA
jgi:hypothetical protein